MSGCSKVLCMRPFTNMQDGKRNTSKSKYKRRKTKQNKESSKGTQHRRSHPYSRDNLTAAQGFSVLHAGAAYLQPTEISCTDIKTPDLAIPGIKLHLNGQ